MTDEELFWERPSEDAAEEADAYANRRRSGST